MKYIRLAIFLAFKDMFSNISSLLFVSAALGFLFANVLFIRFNMYGFETVIGRLIPKVSGQVYAKPLRQQSYIYDTKQTLEELRKNPCLKAASPVLELPCILEYKGSRIVTVVWGIDYNDKVMNLKDYVIDGEYFSGPYANEIILGKILKRRFRQKIIKREDIELGDDVEGIFIKEHNVDKFNRNVYHNKYCKIMGVADFRDYMANNYIFMPIGALRRATILDERSSYVFMRLKDSACGDDIEIDKFNDLYIDAEVAHWKDRDDYGTDDLVLGFNLISLITFTVSIICAAILVAFVIFFNTQKKRRTTGILRAIGIKARVFFIFFVLEGVLFSIIGIVVGTFLYNAIEAYLRKNPIVMPFGDLYPMFEMKSYVFAAILFLVVSFLASIYYALRGSKENIIKIMRGD